MTVVAWKGASRVANPQRIRHRRPSAAERLYDRANRLALDGAAVAALDHYGRALADRPDFAEAHNNRGNVLRTLDRTRDSITAYRTALLLGLHHPLVYYNLATALKDQGETDAAERCFRRALALRPDHAEALNNRANLMRGTDRADAAIDGYRRALVLRPDWDEAHDNLAGALYLLHESGETERVAQLARLWLRDHGDHPVARHIGAALAGQTGESRASDAYVRQVFDHFAEDFEATLAGLGYRAPQILAAAVSGSVPAGADGLDVLDAGCGTGLCAPYLRPLARTLTGVDLSRGMLDRARERGLYDALFADELERFLKSTPRSFDLIVAADVLCYFGDLTPVLRAAGRAARPGGTIAFTVERLDDEAGPFRLLPHGRYAHAEAHVRAALADAGFQDPIVARDVLRQEGGEPVLGLIVLATHAFSWSGPAQGTQSDE